MIHTPQNYSLELSQGVEMVTDGFKKHIHGGRVCQWLHDGYVLPSRFSIIVSLNTNCKDAMAIGKYAFLSSLQASERQLGTAVGNRMLS